MDRGKAQSFVLPSAIAPTKIEQVANDLLESCLLTCAARRGSHLHCDEHAVPGASVAKLAQHALNAVPVSTPPRY